ncbi:MAG: HEAT repeat domain-containing protein, partial [Deltaproteobacteria bacterium]|nr:HEAT repeat domain-containing protein [Deltaproteobacteria bacterium]
IASRVEDQSRRDPVRELLGPDEVPPPDLRRVEPELRSREIREPLDQKAVELLRHATDVVRVAALDYLGTTGTRLHADAVGLLLDDPSADVRASATLALCALRREEAFGRIHHMLEDPDAKVRAHAVAGLIRHGGLDGILACAELLRRMLASAIDKERELAAWVLGEIGVQHFYQPLVPLLADRSEAVRLAAIVAAGHLKSPDLVPHLVVQLAHPRLGSAAVQALIAYGPSILDTAAALLADSEQSLRVRAQVPKILARLSLPASGEILCRHLNDADTEVRAAAVHALTALRGRVPALPLDLAQVALAIRAEARNYVELLALAADLGLDERAPLLHDAIQHRLAQTQGRLLALLSLKYPGETIDLVTRNLKSSQMSIRANAVEVADNLIDKQERVLVLPLIDNTLPPDAKLSAGSAVLPVKRSDRLARLRELLASRDEWLRVAAAVAAGEWQVQSLVPALAELVSAKTPLARETAIVVLRQLADGDALREAVTPLTDDPDPSVRRYAEHALAEASKRPSGPRAEKRPRAGR